ncbi:MAG: hypothetical protein LBG42_01765 [Treponema sp.]|jgi:uncharacterized membrane-anchored protein YhcB (DUF1043 family)|nr:hypothetical protein [Treponema sp.]
MKCQKSLALAAVFLGIVIIISISILFVNLDKIAAAGFRIFGPLWSLKTFMYAVTALVPLLVGVFVILVMLLISRQEDREFEKWLVDASESTDKFYSECVRHLDSIEDSITQIKASSEKLKHEAEKISRLDRKLKNQDPSFPEDFPQRPPAVTFEDYLIRGVKILYEGETIPPELFQSPQFHHREQGRLHK